MNSLIKKALIIFSLAGVSSCCFSQDAYMNVSDTSKNGLFRNFIGIKLFATDIAATSLTRIYNLIMYPITLEIYTNFSMI